jgi:hypothetical protein
MNFGRGMDFVPASISLAPRYGWRERGGGQHRRGPRPARLPAPPRVAPRARPHPARQIVPGGSLPPCCFPGGVYSLAVSRGSLLPCCFPGGVYSLDVSTHPSCCCNGICGVVGSGFLQRGYIIRSKIKIPVKPAARLHYRLSSCYGFCCQQECKSRERILSLPRVKIPTPAEERSAAHPRGLFPGRVCSLAVPRGSLHPPVLLL